MQFNSIDFAIFLPTIFFLYWFVVNQNLKLQNALIVAASYLFYGWWDWRFLSLILFSSLVDFAVGIGLSKYSQPQKRKGLLVTSIVINLAFLGGFKYYNFFVESFTNAFSILGYHLGADSLNIVLPVGISFYTFQTMSYSIDVYRKKLEPTKNFIVFSAFVSFFPQLVAGPIERAMHLLPQFHTPRTFDYSKAVDGLRQILWGLFKKVVIADNCAQWANLIFDNSESYPGSTLILGAFFFAFQIYGDFSGYSDIAIGTSRLFGFDLMRNFAFPYFSRDISEFWRRWHISLSTWFRDYLYIPLGGSKGNTLVKVRNTFIIFTVSGLWHGENWTFVAWGVLNTLYFLPLLLTNTNRQNIDIVAQGKLLPSIKESIAILSTFMLTTIAWIFFRAESISNAILYLSKIFSKSLFEVPYFEDGSLAIPIIILILLFILVEWLGRGTQHPLQLLEGKSRKVSWSVYYLLIGLTFLFAGSNQEFIYFQF